MLCGAAFHTHASLQKDHCGQPSGACFLCQLAKGDCLEATVDTSVRTFQGSISAVTFCTEPALPGLFGMLPGSRGPPVFV